MQYLYKVRTERAAVAGADCQGSEAEGCLGLTPSTRLIRTAAQSWLISHSR